MYPEDKQRTVEAILSGKTPAQVCAEWADNKKPFITYVQRECALCETLLAMDAANQEKVKEIHAVTICVDCFLVIREFCDNMQYLSMIGGKIMTVQEGMIQTKLRENRN